MARRAPKAQGKRWVDELREKRSTMAAAIEAARQERGLSRAEIARRLNTKYLQVWRIENGAIEISADDVIAFADAIGTPAASLYRRAAS